METETGSEGLEYDTEPHPEITAGAVIRGTTMDPVSETAPEEVKPDKLGE